MWSLFLGFSLLGLTPEVGNDGQDRELYELEDLAPHLLLAADGNESMCIIAFAEFIKSPIIRVFLYNKAQQRGFFIEDGRMGHPIGARVFARASEFTILTKTTFVPPVLNVFDYEGRFKKKVDLTDFDGWLDGYSLVSASRYQDKLLATIEILDMEKPKQRPLAIALIDDTNSKVAFLHTITRPGTQKNHHIQWLASGDSVFEVNKTNGQISKVDMQTFEKHEILKALPLADNPNAALFKKLGKKVTIPESLKLGSRIYQAIPQPQFLAIQRDYPLEEDRVELQCLIIRPNSKPELTDNLLHVWQFSDSTLTYEPTEKVFDLSRSGTD